MPGGENVLWALKTLKFSKFCDFMEIHQIFMKLAKFHLFGRRNRIFAPRPPKHQYSLWNINGPGHDFPRKMRFSPKIGNLPVSNSFPSNYHEFSENP